MTKNASVFLAYRKSQAKKSDGDGLTKKKPPLLKEPLNRFCEKKRGLKTQTPQLI